MMGVKKGCGLGYGNVTIAARAAGGLNVKVFREKIAAYSAINGSHGGRHQAMGNLVCNQKIRGKARVCFLG